MTIFLFAAFLGLLTGILVGLIPMMPMYIGSFLLYYFVHAWSLESMLIFWIAVMIGSQFFGSVAAITLGIPGEATSLIYVRDVGKLTLGERASLLYRTAKGSLIAGAISLLIVWGLMEYFQGTSNHSHFISGFKFQIFFYTLAILSFMVLEKKKLFVIPLMIFGIMLGPKNNYVLPEFWYKLQFIFQDLSFYMIVMGLLILPEVLWPDAGRKELATSVNVIKPRTSIREYWAFLKNTLIGCVAGMIPGPGSELASASAYRMAGKNVADKITAAETANNSAVIMLLLPFFALGIPITQSSIIFSNVLDIKSIDIVEAITKPLYYGYNVLEVVMFSGIILTIINFLLAIRFIKLYATLVDIIQNRVRILQFVLLALLIAGDIWMTEAKLGNYSLLFLGTIGVGYILKRLEVNPIPLMFALLLGDKLVWVYVQALYMIF